MSKPRRRKQKKQVKAELKLRQFAATELSDQLAAQHSAADLPRFIVDTVAGAYTPADAELMIEGFGAAATRPVTLRANTLKATAEDITAALDAAGIAHNPVAWYPDAFILPEAQVSDLWDLDIYRDGKIYLQSLSSMMPPLVLGAQAGEDILDMCAAPWRQDDADRRPHAGPGTPHRLRDEHSPRRKAPRPTWAARVPKTCPSCASTHASSTSSSALTASCSTLPALARAPSSAATRKSLRGLTEQLLVKCARSQRALLDRAMGALKPGGTLVYSTCSILPQENEDALQEALDKHMDCELIPSTARRAKAKRVAPRMPARAAYREQRSHRGHRRRPRLVRRQRYARHADHSA